MKKQSGLLLAVCLSFIVPVFAIAEGPIKTGLKNGNNLDAIEIRGEVQVHCFGQPRTEIVRVRCWDEILDPSEYDYFVTDAKMPANKVHLTATHEDGTTKTKKTGFSFEKKQSTKQVNLWIRTLFQRPLLDPGLNKIHYTLLNDKEKVEEGDFEVNVSTDITKECRFRIVHSYNNDDCRAPYNRVCREYFRYENWCMDEEE